VSRRDEPALVARLEPGGRAGRHVSLGRCRSDHVDRDVRTARQIDQKADVDAVAGEDRHGVAVTARRGGEPCTPSSDIATFMSPKKL